MPESAGDAAPTPASRSRRPGEASALADRRGGPANYGGVNFQTWYAVWRILDWLHLHWGDATASGTARCEARVLQATDDGDGELRVGQHGFDFAMTGLASRRADYIEVKLSPTKDEVTDLVSSLKELPADISDDQLVVGLVSAHETADFRRLEQLRRLAGEAVDDAELSARVDAHESEKLSALHDAVGSDGDLGTRQLLIDRMLKPALWPVSVLGARVEGAAAALAGGRDNGDRLLDALFREVAEASAQRRSLNLRELQSTLVNAELMMAGPAAAASALPENEDLAKFVVVLECCPVPVPKQLLARASGRSVHELSEQLAPLVASGHVQAVGDAWARQAVPDAPLSTAWGGGLLADLLQVLAAVASDNEPDAVGQTLNAWALARLCGEGHPRLVGRLFQAFDHHCKTWGDLAVVRQLADMSDVALGRVLEGGDLSEAERAELAYARAQTYICGQGWVLQRVDALEGAVNFMALAEDLAEHYDDAENRAFSLKCLGRLRRMQAEKLPASRENERADLLAESEQLLREAEMAFQALEGTIPARKARDNAGESVSLLARTLATGGRLEDGVAEMDRAEDMLADSPRGKAYADLQILRAEVAHLLADRGDGDEADLAGHVSVLRGLLEVHDRRVHVPGVGADRGASEIVARLHRTVGQLLEDSDPAAAARCYQDAAAIYDDLSYSPGREDALWRRQMASGSLLPDGLLHAFERAEATAGVRLTALDLFDRRSTPGPDGPTMGTTGRPWSEDDFEELVRDASAVHASKVPAWPATDWGRATA